MFQKSQLYHKIDGWLVGGVVKISYLYVVKETPMAWARLMITVWLWCAAPFGGLFFVPRRGERKALFFHTLRIDIYVIFHQSFSDMEQIQICTIKEVQKLVNVSSAQAGRMIRLLRDALAKPRPQIISVNDFKDYYGLNWPLSISVFFAKIPKIPNIAIAETYI